ncbi:hypothetical protein RFI_02663 [Reticulomyxa filosa]|uniref:NACHT domain-containing protein n=1 Tax=Reticulomyxa filosa TaxID=46433 RepID=X6P7E3_RETFI|nr:hypothetical protein RFI_02663 [Reticulomyxa filosa]|eukprot:ETO34430.1 hypothetical protein RFI_02663 [Reticulomyxa filosa]
MGGQIGAEEDLLAQTSSINEGKNNNGKAQSENEQLNLIKQKLKRYYQSQDKLTPLFDDPEQSIDANKKHKMINNQEKEKGKEDEKYKDYKEENGKWPNPLDYSLIYENQTENIKLQDIWNDKENQSKVRHISIQGEAGSGKSVLSQRIAYLWGNQQMWNHRFQYLLHIPLRKIINAFHHINDNMILNTYGQSSSMNYIFHNGIQMIPNALFIQ